LLALPKDLCEDFKKLKINVVIRETKSMRYTMEVQPTLINEIRAVQSTDPHLDMIKVEASSGKVPGSMIDEDGMLRFQN